MMKLAGRIWHDDAGQGLPEYAMLLAAIVMLVVAVGGIYTGHIAMLVGRVGDYIGSRAPTNP